MGEAGNASQSVDSLHQVVSRRLVNPPADAAQLVGFAEPVVVGIIGERTHPASRVDLHLEIASGTPDVAPLPAEGVGLFGQMVNSGLELESCHVAQRIGFRLDPSIRAV